MNVGTRIRQLRKQQKMTTTGLASLVNTTQQSISNYENNKSEPGLTMLESICEALGITLADFFAPERQKLGPELERLLETAQKLSPEQRSLVQQLIENMGKS